MKGGLLAVSCFRCDTRRRLCDTSQRAGVGDVGMADGPQLIRLDSRHGHRRTVQCQKLDFISRATGVDKNHFADITYF